MKKLDKFTMVIAKITEIIHWVGTAGIIFMLTVTCVSQNFRDNMFSNIDRECSTYGFTVEILKADGSQNMAAFITFCAVAIVILTMMAMVARNIYLILKKIGKNVPFNEDVTRMVREIGIFFIVISAVGVIGNIVAFSVAGAEASATLALALIGLLMICLSRVFNYGEQIQSDVDGLL